MSVSTVDIPCTTLDDLVSPASQNHPCPRSRRNVYSLSCRSPVSPPARVETVHAIDQIALFEDIPESDDF